MNTFRKILSPLALIYGVIVCLRTVLYNTRILKSSKFDFPVIVVGNLSVGGTGKTPHIEYLIRLLRDSYKIVTLSRGYGRKSKGYVIADADSESTVIGDEPMQFKFKFPEIPVTVCENRVEGIKHVMTDFINTQVVLLDDAFQHRRLQPGFSVILTDYYDLYTDDKLLPAGNLREFKSGANRADVIIVTKTPVVLSPIEKRDIIAKLNPKPHQKIYFSYIKYGTIRPFPTTINISTAKPSSALLFAGIANIYPFEDHLKRTISSVFVMQYPDHYEYTALDIDKIGAEYRRMMGANKIIITSEKDYMRLRKPEFENILKSLPLHYVEIEIGFHGNDQIEFNQQILSYVGENK